MQFKNIYADRKYICCSQKHVLIEKYLLQLNSSIFLQECHSRPTQFLQHTPMTVTNLNPSVFLFTQAAIHFFFFCKNTPKSCLAAKSGHFDWFMLYEHNLLTSKHRSNMNPTVELNLEFLRWKIVALPIRCYKN